MSGRSEAEKAALKKMRAAEYERRPDRMARSLAYSYERARQKKMATTSRRFEEHPVEDLLAIAVLKCHKIGVDYQEYEAMFRRVFEILHTAPNVQSNGDENAEECDFNQQEVDEPSEGFLVG